MAGYRTLTKKKKKSGFHSVCNLLQPSLSKAVYNVPPAHISYSILKNSDICFAVEGKKTHYCIHLYEITHE